ncbi:MAG: DUF4397 domain-containing protein [Anaerolineae bacterium]
MNKLIQRGAAVLILIVVLAITSLGVLAQSDGNALLRFVHVIPGAGAVDVYTDGQLTVSGLAFATASTYVNVTAGDHQVMVTPAGTTNTLWQQSVSTGEGSALTLVAASASAPNFLIYPEDLNPLPLGKARLTAIHAISGGPAVDLLLSDGRPVIPGLQFGQAAGTLDVPTFVYDFAVAPSGDGVDKALLTADGVALGTGTSFMLVVYGSPDNPASLVLANPTKADGDAGFVRIIHGASQAEAVDIYVNDTLAAPSLKFGDSTGHIAVPAGTYDVAVREAGQSADLITSSLEVAAGEAKTVAALDTTGAVVVSEFTDDISSISPSQARISLINGIVGEGSLSATLADGTVLANGLAYGNAATAVNIAPSSESVTLSAGGSDTEIGAQDFYGGVYYNLLAVDDNGTVKLIGAPTSLAQGVASAPGAVSVVAVEPTAVPPTLAPPPTAVPTTAPVIEPTAVVAEPTQPPPAPATPAGPTGRVFNLNANANLQLRQYPNSDALSLGTVPPGTILTINGREGGIADIPFSATPNAPEGYEFVDPATLLTDPKADLAPEDTWLNVTYTTPDGGTITAWANALYLDVRNPRGEKLKLSSLPTVPTNLPGDVNNSAVTPPPVPANRVAATVFNLDAGVSLNIRRTADVQGEVLARVPNGAVMEFLGIKEDREWVFVRFSPPEGGSVTGWVNSLYVQYSYNDRRLSLEEIETRDLLVITPDDTRGDVSAGVAAAGIPTANPTKNAYVAQVILDTGSNLNLRRNPDADSEVLAQIPSGTEVIVSARTADEKWLNVTFEGVDGWIAAKTDTATFVRVTFNGKAATITEISITGEAFDSTGVSVSSPTATPEQEFLNQPVKVTDAVVAMTGSPGGDNQGLPILTAGQEAMLLFTDGKFSYIELPDGTRGWLPAGAVQLR